ncbi:alpha/beta fold hydrolase [Hyphomicrobium sp.]|uniref:alpha/beta fold hydrolase n=1 Tax=Hyphomicrobium sp. TaxID=82 RepID=UPI0025BE3C6D|nr:alpha/beta fold hydrolase [Hyphomicrobium sp.]
MSVIMGPAFARAQAIMDDGRLVVPERRTLQWATGEGNRELIESTYARISRLTGSTPGSWSYEWMQVASHFEARGDDAARRGDGVRARSAYLKASLYYALGYFPDNASPEQKASYAKHLSTYVSASRFFEHKLEVVALPLEHSRIVVHLHVPPGVTKPPIVLWNGGVDWWKAGYHSLIELLIRRGIAVAAFDLPGTGESAAWTAGLDQGKLHRHVLDHLEQSGRFDFTRVGMVGVSFGGHYAVRVAATEPRVKAAVNFCGPIQRIFNAPAGVISRVMASPEGATLRAAARARGLVPGQEQAGQAERFDLVRLGVVGEGRRIDIPILSVNGGRDPFAPPEDMDLVQRSAPKGEVWRLGTSGHCAVEYGAVVWPQVFDWLEEKLGTVPPRQQ